MANDEPNGDNGRLVSRIYGAGFNAHGQLQPSSNVDLTTFQVIELPESEKSAGSQPFYANWSTIVVQSDRRVHSLGFQRLNQDFPHAIQLRSPAGDDTGLKCCLDQDGRLYTIQGDEGRPQELQCQSNETSPQIGHIALADNGRLALTFKQAPNGNMCHIAEFESYTNFLEWFQDPSGETNYPTAHHMLAGRPKQLVANTGTFLLLLEAGELYTWGDTRYQSLGREVTSADGDKPTMVESLGGLRIQRVAAAGWMSAALADGALYIWGSHTASAAGSISCLETEVSLVQLGGEHVVDPPDVIDVAMGDNHIIALTAEGCFAVGDNSSGQLGLGRADLFFADWKVVQDVTRSEALFCGPKCSLIQRRA